jgi:hypothetical protein
LPVTRHAPICPTFVAARKTERGALSRGSFRQATTTGGRLVIEVRYGAVGRRCAVFAKEDIRKGNRRD